MVKERSAIKQSRDMHAMSAYLPMYQVDFIDNLVDLHVDTSRSEVIRKALDQYMASRVQFLNIVTDFNVNYQGTTVKLRHLRLRKNGVKIKELKKSEKNE